MTKKSAMVPFLILTRWWPSSAMPMLPGALTPRIEWPLRSIVMLSAPTTRPLPAQPTRSCFSFVDAVTVWPHWGADFAAAGATTTTLAAMAATSPRVVRVRRDIVTS